PSGGFACRFGAISSLAPKPRWYAFLGNGLQPSRDAGLPEVLLREHVAGDLAPCLGDFDIALAKDDRTVGISDFARGTPKFDVLISAATFDGELTPDPHVAPDGENVAPGRTSLAPDWRRVFLRRGLPSRGGEPSAALLASSARFGVATRDRGKVWARRKNFC